MSPWGEACKSHQRGLERSEDALVGLGWQPAKRPVLGLGRRLVAHNSLSLSGCFQGPGHHRAAELGAGATAAGG